MFILNFDMDSLNDYLYLLGYVACIVLAVLMLFKLKEWYLAIIPIIGLGVYYIFFKQYLELSNSYLVIAGLSVFILLMSSSNSKKRKPIVQEESISDIKLETDKGDMYLHAIQDGILVYGSAGSGKTKSVLYPIIKHFAKYQYSGVVYDFKDGELTEMLYDLFNEVNVFALHRPDISIRINPIDPKFIKDESDAGQIATVLVINLLKSNKAEDAGNFFVETSEAILTAIILKLAFDHPEQCTLPHMISLILAVDFSQSEEERKHEQGATMGGGNLGDMAFDTFAKLKNFLTSVDRVKMQSASFNLGLANAKQTASVLSTLANMLRKLVSPNNFWLLTKNTHDLSINATKSNIVSILNKPGKREYLSPINALIIHFITVSMQERHREPSFLLLDEAPTIKLANMADIPATMRSFGISTVYCAQDQIQGVMKYSRDGFAEITANLSNVLLGRAFNAETSKGYETLFEKIKEKQRSTSQNTSERGVSKGFSISEREVSKVRAHEFPLFNKGQFAIISNGVQEVCQLKLQNILTKEIPVVQEITEQMLQDNFDKIIKDVNVLISNNYDY